MEGYGVFSKRGLEGISISLSLSLSSIRSLTFVISCIRKFLEIFDIRGIEIVRFRGNSARKEILDIVSFREK